MVTRSALYGFCKSAFLGINLLSCVFRSAIFFPSSLLAGGSGLFGTLDDGNAPSECVSKLAVDL